MCNINFCRSASRGVFINRRESPKVDSVGAPPIVMSAGLTLGNTPLPTCYLAEFGRSRSDSASVMKEIPLINMTPRVPPFKVTQGHRNRHGSIGRL